MAKVRMLKDPRAATFVCACDTLIPLAKATNQLLRRKRMSAAELVRAVPGLAAWPSQHGFDAKPLEIAIAIATGTNPFAIVAGLSGTRRTSAQVQVLYQKWRASQLRRKAV